ncbi:MAG TPA: NAD(P)/FAD-dependent oxidoreductase [Mycobacteriales bacterium]
MSELRESGPERRDAVVVGGGPAGLASAAELRRLGLSVVVIERGGVGASWRNRYDRLRLNTVRQASGLPGRRIPRAAGRWVRRDDFVRYLESYARDLEVRTGTTADRIDRVGDRWQVATTTGTFLASVVVVATGWENTPVLPSWPGIDGFPGPLIHSAAYRRPGVYRARRMLVAGGGVSGTEIAVDLAQGGAEKVWLSIRTPPTILPRERLGVPITAMGGLLDVLPTTLADLSGRLTHVLALGRARRLLPPPAHGVASDLLARHRTPTVVDGLIECVRAGDVELVAAIDHVDADAVVLTDGRILRPDVIVAATGYRRGLEPLVGHLGVLDPDGAPVLDGPTRARSAPGLHFVGYRLLFAGPLTAIRRDSRRMAEEVRTGPATQVRIPDRSGDNAGAQSS